ncbi:hypothetical protein AALO_G00206130 [Alosa alosa]|uniref:Fusion protein IQCJ-SCHIP1 N-terminal domain-containing protein n=1 Tax=Alosa alosa TaxID=278164 RepID=A0AAV6GAP6_9TELE|nr:hypothetical protein AALO_G00206130 [Alosa alosa]
MWACWEELKTLQTVKHGNGRYQLQHSQLTTDVENNIAEVSEDMPLLSKVLVIQRAWRDFQSRQDVLEKRSPSPPSLTSSSDKMSMSISMATLSDGSTPVSPALLLPSCAGDWLVVQYLRKQFYL